MNALSHSQFDLPLAELIAADYAYYDSLIDHGVPTPGGSPHAALMATRCHTLAEVRAKLAWLVDYGGDKEGEEEAFALMLEDIDRLIALQS